MNELAKLSLKDALCEIEDDLDDYSLTCIRNNGCEPCSEEFRTALFDEYPELHSMLDTSDEAIYNLAVEIVDK